MCKLFVPRVVAVIPLTGEMSRSDKRVLFSEKIPCPRANAVRPYDRIFFKYA